MAPCSIGQVPARRQQIYPKYWYACTVVWRRPIRQTGISDMSISDAVYLLFLFICAWLAIAWDSEGGGGKRARLPLKP